MNQQDNRRASMFSDQDGSALGYADPANNASWVSRRSQLISAYVPLSSSNAGQAPSIAGGLNGSGLTSDSHPSGPSLHAEPLDDHAQAAAESRPDSIISSYIRPDNSMPMFRNVFKGERKSSFASDDYQYEPSRNNPFEANSSPLALSSSQPPPQQQQQPSVEKIPVYIASPVPSDDANGSEETDDGLGSNAKMQEGPILMPKGSKASLRRKNTVERLKRFEAKESSTSTVQPSADNSLNSSQSSVGGGVAGVSDDRSPADVKLSLKKSRMSAFTSNVVTTPPAVVDLQGPYSNAPMEPRRDSSTISTISWGGNRSKHVSELSNKGDVDAHGGGGTASTRLQQFFQRGALPLPSSPVASFKQSLSSIHSEQDTSDVFMSLASMHTVG
ncbi:hypothetical protein GGI21_005702, partial [Coemansia aciculifera]